MRGRTLAAVLRWIKKSSVEAVVVHAPRAPRRRAGPSPVDSVGLSNSSTRELALHAAALRPRARSLSTSKEEGAARRGRREFRERGRATSDLV